MRTTRYLRQVPPGAPPRPTGDRPVTPLDIRSHAVRADTGEVTTIADIAAAAHKLTCKDAPTLGLQYRVTEQCFERDAAEPRDIVKASPTLHIPNEVGPVDQRHLTRKFQLGFTAMPQASRLNSAQPGSNVAGRTRNASRVADAVIIPRARRA